MKKLLPLFGILFLSLAGCEKEPEPIASFSLSTYNADVNEVITATNLSINAYSYLWNDGEGNESTKESPSFIYDSEGNYIVSLTAYSESGELSDTYTETINVEQKTGYATFWLSGDPEYYQTTVTIGSESKTITHYYPNGPTDCFQSGCANFILPTGTHSFTATDSEYNWSGTVTIVANECAKMKLQ